MADSPGSVTQEVSDDLDEEIRDQRAWVQSLTDSPLMAETEMRVLESLESQLKDAIIAQEARYKKLRSSTAARSDIYEAYNKLESLKNELREAITQQGARVRKLKVKSEIEEALRRQESLKADYKAAVGSEWSEVREEGPILLTSNKVRGRELFPELRERLKELRQDNVIR